jgi:hypothetical protein
MECRDDLPVYTATNDFLHAVLHKHAHHRNEPLTKIVLSLSPFPLPFSLLSVIMTYQSTHSNQEGPNDGPPSLPDGW